MQLIDLTHTISPSQSCFPGDPAPVLTHTQQHGWQLTQLQISSHCGTHMDAPRHADPLARSLDKMELNRFLGLALMLDVSPYAGGEIPLSVLEEHAEELKCCEFLVLKSGWDRKWGREDYLSGYPVLSAEAADYLAGLEYLQGVGLDTISADPVDSADCPVHKALLGADKLIIENLCNLDSVAGRNFLLCCLPLKYTDADASPVRAAAFLAPAGIYYPS